MPSEVGLDELVDDVHEARLLVEESLPLLGEAGVIARLDAVLAPLYARWEEDLSPDDRAALSRLAVHGTFGPDDADALLNADSFEVLRRLRAYLRIERPGVLRLPEPVRRRPAGRGDVLGGLGRRRSRRPGHARSARCRRGRRRGGGATGTGRPAKPLPSAR